VKLYLNAGSPSLQIGVTTVSASSFDTDSWKPVAATWKSGEVNIYINGVEAGIGNAPGAISGGSSFAIGNGFEGTIDEVRVYGKAADAAEAKSIYLDSGLLVNRQLLASQG